MMYIVLALIFILFLFWLYEARVFLLLFEKLCYRVYKIPSFIEDISRYLPDHERILIELPKIQQEYQDFIHLNKSAPKAHEVDPYNREISNDAGPAWRTFYLKVYNGWFTENTAYFPETTHLFSGMPEVTCVMFSAMEPGNVIPPHKGMMRGILRYQIPLHLSPRGQCRIYVNDQEWVYQPNKPFMFDDNNTHSVRNETDDFRVVLFLDVQKPSSSLIRFLDNLFMRLVVLSPKFKRANVGLR